jgi:hypothetical protein
MQPAPSKVGIGQKRHLLVGRARVWLVTPSVLIGLVAVAGLGRYALGTVTTRVGSTSAAVHIAAANDVTSFDTSPHKAMFVTVDADVHAPGLRTLEPARSRV